jgi:hypothetical protein
MSPEKRLCSSATNGGIFVIFDNGDLYENMSRNPNFVKIGQ